VIGRIPITLPIFTARSETLTLFFQPDGVRVEGPDAGSRSGAAVAERRFVVCGDGRRDRGGGERSGPMGNCGVRRMFFQGRRFVGGGAGDGQRQGRRFGRGWIRGMSAASAALFLYFAVRIAAGGIRE